MVLLTSVHVDNDYVYHLPSSLGFSGWKFTQVSLQPSCAKIMTNSSTSIQLSGLLDNDCLSRIITRNGGPVRCLAHSYKGGENGPFGANKGLLQPGQTCAYHFHLVGEPPNVPWEVTSEDEIS